MSPYLVQVDLGGGFLVGTLEKDFQEGLCVCAYVYSKNICPECLTKISMSIK